MTIEEYAFGLEQKIKALEAALAAAEQERDALRSEVAELRQWQADFDAGYEAGENRADWEEEEPEDASAVWQYGYIVGISDHVYQELHRQRERADAAEQRAKEAEALLPNHEMTMLLWALADNLRLADFVLATGEGPESLQAWLAALRGGEEKP